MSKREELVDTSLLAQIRSLFDNLNDIIITRTARNEMDRLRLSLTGVCDVACDYLDNGRPVDVTITDTVQKYIGIPMYELHPDVGSHAYYLKVKIDDSGDRHRLVIVSFHDHE